mmetsp:Transcript_12843/g.34794  ORF Transcript_12843/g.34794 Transcript_12843/m.34794 type:complete len:229 (+) Transcript_12843:590-1276(+)
MLRLHPIRRLVPVVAERPAHGELPIYSIPLDEAASAHDAGPLLHVARLVVLGQRAVGALAPHHGAILAAQQDPAVADVSHPQPVPPTGLRRRVDDGEGPGAAGVHAGVQELLVQPPSQGEDNVVVHRRVHGVLGVQLLHEPLGDEGRTLAAAVAVEDPEEAPVGPHQDHVRVLHGRPPAVHLREAHAEWRVWAAIALDEHRLHRPQQAQAQTRTHWGTTKWPPRLNHH